MDHGEQLVLTSDGCGVGVGVRRSELRPPVVLQARLEQHGVENCESVARGTPPIVGHESEFRCEREVGPDEDVAQEARTTHERSRVPTLVAGAQAHVVKVVTIARLGVAHRDHRHATSLAVSRDLEDPPSDTTTGRCWLR